MALQCITPGTSQRAPESQGKDMAKDSVARLPYKQLFLTIYLKHLGPEDMAQLYTFTVPFPSNPG